MDLLTWFQRYRSGDRKLGSRAATFRIALSLLEKNGDTNFVETGTTRKNHINCPCPIERCCDGASTVLFGDFCNTFGGKVWTCDIDENNINNCKIATEEYKKYITYIVDDSLNFLRNFNQRIDFLYLDSVDGTDQYAHIHQLKEIEIALPKLHENSIVLLDDLYSKTNMSIPFLLKNKWLNISVNNCPKSANPSQALFVHENNFFFEPTR